jgi:hypothetical protein
MNTPFPHPGGTLSGAARRAHRWAQWIEHIECPDPEDEELPLRTERKTVITIKQTIEIHHDRPESEESGD